MVERKENVRVSPNTIIVVGMGMSPGDLSRKALAIVEKADILIGGKRHLSYFAHLPAEKVPLYKNFEQVIRTIKASLKKKKRIVVIASGDPGYHGIARYLIKHLGKDTIEIVPNITTFQAAFAKIKESWDDALLLSAHGHSLPHLASLLKKHNKIGILTDEKNTPAAIARQVLEKDPSLNTTIAFIVEQLGTKEEKIRKYHFKNVVGKKFSSLNAMILFPPASGRKEDEIMHLGIPDKRFSHQGGLITKEDIRIFTLAKLNLPRGGVFWDVGSGSGSVAIQASILAPDLRVYAVEKHKKRISDIKRNCKNFQREQFITPVPGEAPGILKALPKPHRIFIGGTEGQLLPILRYCKRALLPDGKIVINAATLETVNAAVSFFDRSGWISTVTLLNISKMKKIGTQKRFQPLNPIFVIEGSQSK
jgi:precorrin-6Y C5,15-methyltransferase (decarboxylating)